MPILRNKPAAHTRTIETHMRRLSNKIGVFVTLITLMVGTSAAQADALCKNVKFEFKNSHNTGKVLRVVKVKYFDKEDNKWRTENVKNTECNPNQTCTTGKEDLEYVGNEDIIKIKFVYELKSTSIDLPVDQGPEWFTRITGGVKKPEYTYCKADKTFRKSPGQPFVIFGNT